jgi:enoyl-CoA hydratase
VGLVNQVFSRDELYPAAEAMAERIMSCAPIAVRYAKEAITRGLDLSLEEGLALESKLAALVAKTEDASEGIKALVDRRSPRFQNR